MPVEVIETTDVLTDMVQFRTSPVYEMIVSLHTLRAGRRHREWASKARAALGRAFIAELEATYGVFGKHIPLIELAVDYTDHQDVPGFIHYVRNMDAPTFAFYVTGRIVPITEMI